MASDRRFFVRSPDGKMIAGYDAAPVAEQVARDYGDGAHMIDTAGAAYYPMIQEVAGGELVYLDIGGWDAQKLDAGSNLIEAVKKGHLSLVHAYLAKGADPNFKDRNRAPALNWAVAGKDPAIAALLIEKGADVSATDADGVTARDLAARQNKPEMVAVLASAAP